MSIKYDDNDDMAHISLSPNPVAIVDDADFDRIKTLATGQKYIIRAEILILKQVECETTTA